MKSTILKQDDINKINGLFAITKFRKMSSEKKIDLLKKSCDNDDILKAVSEKAYMNEFLTKDEFHSILIDIRVKNMTIEEKIAIVFG